MKQKNTAWAQKIKAISSRRHRAKSETLNKLSNYHCKNYKKRNRQHQFRDMKDQCFWLGSLELYSTIGIDISHLGKVSSSPIMSHHLKKTTVYMHLRYPRGLEATLALKPGRVKALGGHYEWLRNKLEEVSSQTMNPVQHNTNKLRKTKKYTSFLPYWKIDGVRIEY